MALDAQVRQLLNLFSMSQPALQRPGQPAGSPTQDSAAANPQLGDLLAAALNDNSRMADAVYDFSTMTGAIGTYNLQPLQQVKGLLGETLTWPDLAPAGAIVTRVWTDTLTTLTSAGSATVAILMGTDTLVAATAYNDASLVGTQNHPLTAPVKSANGGPIQLAIAGAALTAGKLRVMVEYIVPNQSQQA